MLFQLKNPLLKSSPLDTPFFLEKRSFFCLAVRYNQIMPIIKFPDGFKWGSAASAYQVEGGVENNDWTQAAREGKMPPAGHATDHYHLYEQDFDLAKSLWHNSHRFSI